MRYDCRFFVSFSRPAKLLQTTTEREKSSDSEVSRVISRGETNPSVYRNTNFAKSSDSEISRVLFEAKKILAQIDLRGFSETDENGSNNPLDELFTKNLEFEVSRVISRGETNPSVYRNTWVC